MIVLGIDPGLKGAITFLGEDSFILDLPTMECDKFGRRIDTCKLAKELANRLKGASDVRVCIEALATGNHREQSRSNAASVGSQFWTQSAIVNTLELLGLAVHEAVHPQTWKGLYGLKGKSGDDKALAMRKARELVADLYPQLADYVQRQMDHNRAESVLIAHWYRKVKA